MVSHATNTLSSSQPQRSSSTASSPPLSTVPPLVPDPTATYTTSPPPHTPTDLDQEAYHDVRTFNHVMKCNICRICERVGTLKLLPGYGSTAPLLIFDCDGLLAHQYIFNGGWSVVPVTGDEPVKVMPTIQGFEESGVKVEQPQGRFVRM